MYRITFLDEAVTEIEHAANWYNERQEGLGDNFIDNVLASLDKLQSDRLILSPVYRGLSRTFIKRFPYILYFKKDIPSKLITVFGVLHAKQSKSHLNKRA